MPTLIANKSMTYATRRLLPGDAFEASDRDARLLIAIKKAKGERQPGRLQAPPASLAGKVTGDVGALRAEYERVVGKRPFNGWDAAELTKRIAEAR